MSPFTWFGQTVSMSTGMVNEFTKLVRERAINAEKGKMRTKIKEN